MPLLFSQTQYWLSDLKAVEVCQKQAEAVSEKPATSRLFNAQDFVTSQSNISLPCSEVAPSKQQTAPLLAIENHPTPHACVPPTHLCSQVTPPALPPLPKTQNEPSYKQV